jgi:putative ABC transport system substrate-binding protein
VKQFWIFDPSAKLRTCFGFSIKRSGGKKAICFALAGLLIALGIPVDAQQPAKVPRIGYVSATGDPNNPGPQIAAFRRGLRDLSYIEGKNILIEYRYAEGNLDRAPALVAELVRVKVDVLVVTFLAAIRAAKEATKTIPIVMETNQDPVARGIVDSLARPGGNITGGLPGSAEN